MEINYGDIEEKLRLVSNRMKSIKNDSLNEICAIGIIDIDTWEWAQGVGICGMYCWYMMNNDEKELKWITDWIDNNINKGLPQKNINTVAPMYTVASIAQNTKNYEYMKICEEWAEWVMQGLPRTSFRGFQHVTSDNENYMQLWDDTLFMTVLFLAKMGIIKNNKDYIQECEYQFLLHTQYLQDKTSGLWYHGWTFDGNHNFCNALWGRGNCWITAFIPDYIEMMGKRCSITQYMVSVLKAQVEALEKYQDKNGLWHTLINDDSSYCEVSATAGFAYGILKGIRTGILDKKYEETALKAVKAVIENIDEDGTVLNVSYGTGMGYTLQAYKDIPICPMTYGQSMVIMMLAEVLKH